MSRGVAPRLTASGADSNFKDRRYFPNLTALANFPTDLGCRFDSSRDLLRCPALWIGPSPDTAIARAQIEVESDMGTRMGSDSRGKRTDSI
ncbi:MAG: hypothetical protein ACP5D7_09905 [Limnospira sp.]